jgi:hypothetical protein
MVDKWGGNGKFQSISSHFTPLTGLPQTKTIFIAASLDLTG